MIELKRRAFVAGLALSGCESQQIAQSGHRPRAASPPQGDAARVDPAKTPEQPGESGAIARRRLGVTGERVSALGIGGHHLGLPSEAEAIRIMHRAIDAGITFFDNCWDYHDGESERRMGKALRDGKRDQVFLMTKLDGRNRQAAMQQLEDSLHRLRVDCIDLVQVHEVIRDEDPEWVFGEDGAIEALRLAQKSGKLRFIGFTGHKSPDVHLEMLRVAEAHDFRFDAVQMPLNVMDPHYDSFENEVLPVLTKNHIGVLGMKPLGSGDILTSGVVSAEECLRYALSLPTSVVITGCDSMSVIEQAIAVGTAFQPMSEEERRTLLAKTRPAGKNGRFEKFKTTEKFDATERNRHWLTGGTIDKG